MDDCPDGSYSCAKTPWESLFDALNSTAGTLSTKFNVGMGTFPGGYYEYEDCFLGIFCDTYVDYYNFGECIDLKDRTTPLANFNDCKSPYAPLGGTPLLEAFAALEENANNYLYNFSPDPHSADRAKAVVVITDAQLEGENGSPTIEAAVNATANLASHGIKVYYMGFEGSVFGEHLNQLANAGGTNVWYPVTDTNSIIAALNSISASIVSCTATVELAEGTDPTRISVEINNNGTLEPVEKDDTNGWSLNMTDKTVTLNGTSCSKLQSYAQVDSGIEEVEIIAKYEGYIIKQKKEAEGMRKLDNMKIPSDIDYLNMDGLALEARSKLNTVRPLTIGQASRISGVNPADISMLILQVKKHK